MRSLLELDWNPEYHMYSLAETVRIKKRSFERKAVSALIAEFQSGRKFEIKQLDILDASFNLEQKVGSVKANIEYRDLSKHEDEIIKGACSVSYVFDEPVWRVSRFRLPGF